MAGINGLGASFSHIASMDRAGEKLSVAMRSLDRAHAQVGKVFFNRGHVATRDEKIQALAELMRLTDIVRDAAKTAPAYNARDARDKVAAVEHAVDALMIKERITEADVRAHIRHHTSSTGGLMISPGFSRRMDA